MLSSPRPQARLQRQTGETQVTPVPSMQRLRNRVAEDEIRAMQDQSPFADVHDEAAGSVADVHDAASRVELRSKVLQVLADVGEYCPSSNLTPDRI